MGSILPSVIAELLSGCVESSQPLEVAESDQGRTLLTVVGDDDPLIAESSAKNESTKRIARCLEGDDFAHVTGLARFLDSRLSVCHASPQSVDFLKDNLTPSLTGFDGLSRANMPKSPNNPSGFASRLQALMSGFGYKSRDVSRLSGVSHQTIENWLANKHQATAGEVEKVAKVFGWTYDQLYAGKAPADIMDRFAQLDGFRALAHRRAREIVSGGDALDVDVPAMNEAHWTTTPPSQGVDCRDASPVDSRTRDTRAIQLTSRPSSDQTRGAVSERHSIDAIRRATPPGASCVAEGQANSSLAASRGTPSQLAETGAKLLERATCHAGA